MDEEFSKIKDVVSCNREYKISAPDALASRYRSMQHNFQNGLFQMMVWGTPTALRNNYIDIPNHTN